MTEYQKRTLSVRTYWIIGSVGLAFSIASGCNRDSAVSDRVPKGGTTAGQEVPAKDVLHKLVLETLQSNLENRELSADRNAAWQVIHGAVAYGLDLPMNVDGQKVPAVEYLLNGGELRGWEVSTAPVLPVTNRPGIRVRVEAGSFVGQGHVDQWLGYLSQAEIPLSQPVVIGSQTLSVEDWARQSQWEISDNPYREYSWTLIALTNLFPKETSWTAKDGKKWTLEPIVRFEAQQPLSASACGGMHRLMGLAHAVRYRKSQVDVLDGGWLLAKQQVDQAISSIRRYQNADGSFSTNFTERPGASADYSMRISATGHTLEFLAFALEKEQLHEPWVERGAYSLCKMLGDVADQDMECGGLYHGLAGLRLYADRAFDE